MKCRTEYLLPTLLVALLLAGCQSTPKTTLPGTLEWDRINVLAETSEPVIALKVHEGEPVQAGQLLLRLDPRRTDARLAVAQADAHRLAAQLVELRHGARSEDIDAARAELARTRSNANLAERENQRMHKLYQRGFVAQTKRDDAANALRVARAGVKAARAQLTKLLHGTRPEQLAQAEAALAGAQAQVKQLQLARERLDVRAPRAGRVDALPFRLGDQPPVGATLVSLLSGPAPYARVFVPERMRASVHPGQHFQVHVDGIDKAFDAVLRSVRSEPAFTPYYALSGDDATRLSWRAELVLQGAAARKLPAGLPCHAEPARHAQ